MSHISDYKIIRVTLARKLSSLKWGLSLLLGVVANLLYANVSVGVASVILQYHDIRTVVPLGEVEAFTKEGEMSKNLQEFFQRIPLSPEVARNFLTDPVIPSKSFKLDNTTAEFLTIQFNKLVGTPLAQAPTDALRTVVTAAIKDDHKWSLLELILEYPEPQVRVELSKLEHVQNDISLFTEKIQPVMGLVDVLLVDAACGCELTPIGPAKISPQTNLSEQIMRAEISKAGYAQVPDCSIPRATTTVEPEAIASRKAVAKPESLVVAANNPTSTASDRQLVFTYGPLQGSLLIRDLANLAKTGEISRSLRSYLKLAKVNPENLRNLLTKEVKVNLRFLDTNLNSILGEYALFQIGQIASTRSQQANIQALRSALVLSASDDNRISLIEFLEKYPLSQVYVDGVKLARQFRSIKRAGGVEGFAIEKLRRVEDFLVEFQSTATVDKCECESE